MSAMDQAALLILGSPMPCAAEMFDHAKPRAAIGVAETGDKQSDAGDKRQKDQGGLALAASQLAQHIPARFSAVQQTAAMARR